MFWTHKQESKIEKIQLKKQNQMLKVKSVGGRQRETQTIKVKKKKNFLAISPQSTVEMLRTSPFGVGEGRWYLKQFPLKYPYTHDFGFSKI